MLFSRPHIAAIAVIFTANIMIYIFSTRIKEEKICRRFRLSLALLLILQEISFHVWNIYIGDWSIKYTLPLQLCGISTILSAVMLINNSFYVYEVVYFWGIGGAIQAIMTPEIGVYTYPHYRYFQFFLGHGAIIAACIFMTFVQGYSPKFKSVLKAMAALNIYAAFVAVFNKITGANYLFICQKPEVSSIMDYLGKWPWYILSLEFVAFAIFTLLYSPFAIRNILNKTGKKNNYLDFS